MAAKGRPSETRPAPTGEGVWTLLAPQSTCSEGTTGGIVIVSSFTLFRDLTNIQVPQFGHRNYTTGQMKVGPGFHV